MDGSGREAGREVVGGILLWEEWVGGSGRVREMCVVLKRTIAGGYCGVHKSGWIIWVFILRLAEQHGY